MNSLPVVTSALLSGTNGVSFGMSTRKGGSSQSPFDMNTSFNVGDERDQVFENRRRLFAALGVVSKSVAQPRQCHSSRVSVVDRPGWYDGVDGLVTSQKQLWLGVSVADCVPVFLAHRDSICVAAVHAGWRGTAEGIVPNAIAHMESSYGVRADHLVAFIGPSAGPCCYEVGNDVIARFDSNVVVSRDGRTYLDLKRANEIQLLASGIPRSSIEVNTDCTICNSELYHSYRRDGNRSGRMAGFIALL